MDHNLETSENNLERIVLNPIIFLDLFDYPVTAFEVWHYLNKKQIFTDVIDVLDRLVQKNILSTKNGFYFLVGREAIIDTRLRRYNYTCAKIKKRDFLANYFLFPFIKSIAVANSIGAYNLRQGSDIDFLSLARLTAFGLVVLFPLV